MVYTARKNLLILELKEERDTLFCDELISLLRERPSYAIYIELRGLLYGIITPGDIIKTVTASMHQVTINKCFKSIHTEKNTYMQSRYFFKENDRIRFVPVVDSEGELLGELAREDDLPARSYAVFVANNLDIGKLLRERKTVLVRPIFQKKQEIFLFWEQLLESKGTVLEVIDYEDVESYVLKNPGANELIFVDEVEAEGARGWLKIVKSVNPAFVAPALQTYKKFFQQMMDETDSIVDAVHQLQAQNIAVLAFDFIENEHGYLEKFTDKILKRYRRRNIPCISQLYPELQKEFLSELYEEQRNERLPLDNKLILTEGGYYILDDIDTPFIHVHEGKRQTVGQPEMYERCIYVAGPCFIEGVYVEDKHTIPSLLQKELNLSGFSCKVVNLGALAVRGKTGIVKALREDLKQGDIVVFDAWVFDMDWMLANGIPTLNLTDALEESQVPVEWVLDEPRHCNHKMNQVCAKAIYKKLLPVLSQPVESRKSIKKENNITNCLYIHRYFSNFDSSRYEKIGSIVMNCNPFTFGHRHLIEYAASHVDYLIIFVVEENASLFTFEERFAMICDGTADLKNVKVVPSGEFILSKLTFPEYFIKEVDEDIQKNTETDITFFAEKIAPVLGITHRFVGEEPEDQVTNIYNQTMKKILPAHGIELVEIPRKQDGKAVISASRVRKCLKNDDLKTLNTLVPESTKAIMFYVNE